MGLPEIQIDFKTKGGSVIKRSAQGIVACVLRDDTMQVEGFTVLSSVADIEYTQWTERNFEYLKLVYLGAPSKVIVVRVTDAGYAAALQTLRDLRWNYLAIPGLEPENKAEVAAWIKEQRDLKHKTFKAVLPNSASDHEGIINFTTDNITILDGEEQKTYSCAEYCARIAGLLAGLSLDRSCTYFQMDEIVKASVPSDPNERIDQGELVLVYDTNQYLIGRGVNSLVTFTGNKSREFSKIKIIEGKDMYMDDIRATFKESYVGKVINDYDNKQALVAAINNYHRQLEGNVLDRQFTNLATIDLEAQRNYLEGQGINTGEWNDAAILEANTGSAVFLAVNIKFVDAMEDLYMVVYM